MHPLDGLKLHELGKELKAEPSLELVWKIARAFYDEFSVDAVDDTMWLSLTIAITASSDDVDDKQRHALLWLYQSMKVVNRAMHYLSTQKLPAQAKAKR